MRRTSIRVTERFYKAAQAYQAAHGLKSLSAAIEALGRAGLAEAGVTVEGERPQWGGHRWDGDTRPFSER